MQTALLTFDRTWQGLGDLVNRFRVKTLGLEPMSTLWAPGQLFRLKVPYTYLWSPGLIPKPPDWGPEIDIAGFVFLDLASSFEPPKELTDFLDDGGPPVYIGFGSIVVDDPEQFTSLVFDAVKMAGVRALVSKGWGGLGEGETPENIFMLGNTPHDWLFPRCSAVVHHGGAGTTAIGLKCGKPTMIVPFFGDQPFWGAMVARAGAGAREPIPYKQLTAERLAEGIKRCLSPEAKIAAKNLAKDIAEEGDGAKNAVESFHRHLPSSGPGSVRCSILPEKVATWCLRHSDLHLCSLAASILVRQGKIKWSELKLVTIRQWTDFEGPGEPITGGGAAVMNSIGTVAKELGGVPIKWTKSISTKTRQDSKQLRTTKSSKPKRLSRKGLPHKPRADKALDRNVDKEYQSSKKQLPNSHEITGRATELLKRDIHAPNGHKLRPASSSPRHEEEAFIESEGSGNNIVLDLAEETGVGIAKAGGALAKGMFSFGVWDSS